MTEAQLPPSGEVLEAGQSDAETLGGGETSAVEEPGQSGEGLSAASEGDGQSNDDDAPAGDPPTGGEKLEA